MPLSRFDRAQPDFEGLLAAARSRFDDEAEIFKLVAEGLTNPQIAHRFYLSPRTVGQHLRSVYRKLGVPSRAAA